jgi:hypothetical protein
MLDSLPGVRMSGENKGTLLEIKRMIENIDTEFQFHRAAGTKESWGHLPLPDGAFSCVAQHMMEAINPPPLNEQGRILYDDTETIVGFKTIRLLQGNPVNDDSIIQFIKNMFPCSRIIINYRSNVEAQMQSQHRAFGGTTVTAENLREQNERLRHMAKLFGPEQAKLIDSTEWTQDVTILNDVVSWLGFDINCHFTELLEFNTRQKYSHGRVQTIANPECQPLTLS